MLDTRLREIINTGDENLIPYDRYGSPVPGMSWLPLSGERLNDQFECFLLRMDAGARSTPHEHTGFEEFLVVDGELVDCDGSSYRAGDFVRFSPGSRHSSHAPRGCTLLVMLRGRNRALGDDEIRADSNDQAQ
jgi:anti-sigma factor ChrR (cupin superfamily)